MNRNEDFVLTAGRQSGRAARERKHSHRHDIWLWLCLDRYENAELDPATCNGITMTDVIARYLKRSPNLLERINPDTDRLMVRDDLLKWIVGDSRQYEWLRGRIERITDLNLSRSLVHLTGRNHLIAMLDLWDVEIGYKAVEIESLRNHWIRHKARDSDFEWFENKEEGPQRCKCAWEWLNKSSTSLFSLRDPISNYQELLMFFDQAEYGPNEQKAIIEKIKQSWSQKKYRARTKAAGKKQLNVEISSTAIDLLDELAKKHELTRPEVVERLIIMGSGLGMIEKHLTRHASKEPTVEAGSSTQTHPTRPDATIDEKPVPHSQQTQEAKGQPTSSVASNSATPLSTHPISEAGTAKPGEREADIPDLNAQGATQSPTSEDEPPITLGDLLLKQGLL